jgi:hypothetical protein
MKPSMRIRSQEKWTRKSQVCSTEAKKDRFEITTLILRRNTEITSASELEITVPSSDKRSDEKLVTPQGEDIDTNNYT